MRTYLVVVDELFDLIVKELSPFDHDWSILGTKVDEEPEPTLQTTNFVFRPAIFPTEVVNSKLDEFLIIVPD